MKKLTSIIIIIVVILSVCVTNTSATGYKHTVQYSYATIAGSYSYLPRLRSPLPTYSNVNSKCNEPRSIGTNPHKGTDLRAGQGTAIYPVCNGKVTSIVNSGSSAHVIIKLDKRNHNDYSTARDYYAIYMHIRVVSGLALGNSVNPNTSIGRVASKAENANLYDPHLHFGIIDTPTLTDTTKYFPLGSFYKDTSDWTFGQDLDFITNVWSSGSYIHFHAYQNGRTAIGPVKLYYRKPSASTWTIVALNGSSELGYGNISYNFDFKNVIKKGETVYWYIAAARTNTTSYAAITYFPLDVTSFNAKTSFPSANTAPPSYEILKRSS